MKRIVKRNFIAVLFAAIVLCFAAGLAGLSRVGATDEVQTASFKTTTGAWIRTADPTGIRFAATISKTDYESIIAADGNAEFGMAIGRTASIAELKNKAEAEPEKYLFKKDTEKWSAGKNPASESDIYEYTFAITNMKTENYNVSYAALAYVKAGGTVYYSQSESDVSSVRTALQVAAKHISLNPEEDTEFAGKVIDEVLDGENKQTFAFDKTEYVDGETPRVTVGGVEIVAEISCTGEVAGLDENNALYGIKKGTGKLVATLKGANKDYTCEASVVISSLKANPVVSDGGIVTLDTHGETASIEVYDGETKVVSFDGITADTFDLYDGIISYRETNNVTADAAYTIVVKSENYSGETTTATIVEIDGLSKFHIENGGRYGYNIADVTAGKYYYLSKDIDVSSRIRWHNKDMFVGTTTLNLDGRGHKIISGENRTDTTNGSLFVSLVNSNIKNLVFEYDSNYSNFDHQGVFAHNALNVKLENCYFRVKLNNTAATGYNDVINGFDGACAVKNCVFELTDVNTEDAYPLTATGEVSKNTIFTDCAVITAQEAEMIKGTGMDIQAVYSFDTVEAFATSADKGEWSAKWAIDENEIKLCGRQVRKVGKEDAALSISADGILTFSINGETATVTVLNGETEVTSFAGVSGGSFDLYDGIISYREKNSITAEAAYNIVLASENYKGEITTATIVPISTFAGFASAAKASESSKYYYLTNDITVNKTVAATYIGQNILIPGNGNMTSVSINVDGRGNKLSYTENSTGKPYLLFQKLDGSNIKNLVVDYNGSFATREGAGLFAYHLNNCAFTNCYFGFDVNITGTNTAEQCIIREQFMFNTLNNCVFAINDARTDDGFPLKITDGNCGSTKIYNSAVIYKGTDGNVTGVASVIDSLGAIVYSDFGFFTSESDFAANKTGTWSDKWTIDASSIKLCGKTVADLA